MSNEIYENATEANEEIDLTMEKDEPKVEYFSLADANPLAQPVGLEDVPARTAGKVMKEQEYDLVASLLEAADFQNDEDLMKEVEMRRNGKLLFVVHVHPLSDEDVNLARKKATAMYPNPAGRKFPKVSGEFSSKTFNSWLIYLATTPEDQQRIWNNSAVKKKYGLAHPTEVIDKLLMAGEKIDLANLISDISKLNDDEEVDAEPEDYAKN